MCARASVAATPHYRPPIVQYDLPRTRPYPPFWQIMPSTQSSDAPRAARSTGSVAGLSSMKKTRAAVGGFVASYWYTELCRLFTVALADHARDTIARGSESYPAARIHNSGIRAIILSKVPVRLATYSGPMHDEPSRHGPPRCGSNDIPPALHRVRSRIPTPPLRQSMASRPAKIIKIKERTQSGRIRWADWRYSRGGRTWNP